MRGDGALYPGVVGFWMSAPMKTNQNKNEEQRPSDEERGHEPVRELENVIDLITVLGSVGRLPEELIDQREAIHPCPNPQLIAREVPWGSGRAAKCCN